MNIKELASKLNEGDTKYNIVVTKKGKESIVNKKPLNKKDALELMSDYEKSGVGYDSLDMNAISK